MLTKEDLSSIKIFTNYMFISFYNYKDEKQTTKKINS